MRNFFIKLMLVVATLLAFTSNSFAAEPDTIKKEFLQTLEKDGYISAENAAKATQQYKLQDAPPSAVAKYLNISNGFKAVGFLMLVWAFWGFIRNIIISFKNLILMVPVSIYQAISLVISLSLIYKSTDFWVSQAQWISIFGVIATALNVVWIFSIHKRLAETVFSVLSLGFIKPSMLTFFAATAYFGFYAIQVQSEILGFIAVVNACCLMSFTISVFPGVVALDLSEKFVSITMLTNTVLLGVIGYCKLQGIPIAYFSFFEKGVFYYMPIGTGLAMLVGLSPWYRGTDKFLSVILSAITIGTAIFMLGIPTMSTSAVILLIFAVLAVLEWVAYVSFSAHLMVGLAITGGTLFGLAVWLESNMPRIVAALQLT